MATAPSSTPPDRSDLVVIGGGLVGLATAYRMLERRPGLSVTVLEKEPMIASHQSGRNSGVIHSGVYYTPGSAKARMCRRGRQELLAFARTHGIAHEVCGKVVVATSQSERPALARIAERGRANGVAVRMVGPAELARLEPAVTGVQALQVDDAGIIDFVAVARTLARLITERGGTVVTDTPVVAGTESPDEVRLTTAAGEIRASAVIACAGLHSDRVAALFTDGPLPVRILPFRGEYYALDRSAVHLCRNLIYPVPDPRFPFLGVHLTRHISGRVLAGPNAVPALAREGYRWRQASWPDVKASVTFPGSRRLAADHWRTGLGEIWRSIHRPAFVAALRRMTPDISARDLHPYPAGVRAQAVFPDGRLADDFVFHSTPRTVHVLNAPSPAATASLAIGEALADKAADRPG